MTAEVLLLFLLFAATAVAAGVAALLLAAFGQAGWFLILALVVAAGLAWRIAEAHTRAARGDENLRDEWRRG
jgi:membrane protein implicated in regulation of membrane protease activity